MRPLNIVVAPSKGMAIVMTNGFSAKHFQEGIRAILEDLLLFAAN